MTDRELLELAAKAAGIEYDPELSKPHPVSGAWWGLWLVYHREPTEFDRRYWNPLKDDSDALRLASKLKINIDFDDGCAWKRPITGGLIQEFWGGDHDPCYRRAIVRAASEIAT